MHGDWLRLIYAALGVCTLSLVRHQGRGKYGLIILIGVNSERHGNSLPHDARLIAHGLALHTMCILVYKIHRHVSPTRDLQFFSSAVPRDD